MNCKTNQNLWNFKHDRNKGTKAIKYAVQKYENSIANEARYNTKAVYKYINSKCNNQHGIGSIKLPNGKLVQDDADKAEALNTYFYSVFTQEDTTNIPTTKSKLNIEKHLKSISIKGQLIQTKLESIHTDKSADPDNLHP